MNYKVENLGHREAGVRFTVELDRLGAVNLVNSHTLGLFVAEIGGGGDCRTHFPTMYVIPSTDTWHLLIHSDEIDKVKCCITFE